MARTSAETGADLEGLPNAVSRHIGEAVQYCSLDRTYWAQLGGDGRFRLPPGSYRVDAQFRDPTTIRASLGFAQRSVFGKGQTVTVRERGRAEVHFVVDPFEERLR